MEIPNLKLQPGEWYAWEVFPSTSRYPNNSPIFLHAITRSARIRGGMELQVRFGSDSHKGEICTVDVHPKKKSTGYWVSRLSGCETPEPTVVISILNQEWLYVHCPALRKYLGHTGIERPIQALMNETFAEGMTGV